MCPAENAGSSPLHIQICITSSKVSIALPGCTISTNINKSALLHFFPFLFTFQRHHFPVQRSDVWIPVRRFLLNLIIPLTWLHLYTHALVKDFDKGLLFLLLTVSCFFRLHLHQSVCGRAELEPTATWRLFERWERMWDGEVKNAWLKQFSRKCLQQIALNLPGGSRKHWCYQNNVYTGFNGSPSAVCCLQLASWVQSAVSPHFYPALPSMLVSCWSSHL